MFGKLLKDYDLEEEVDDFFFQESPQVDRKRTRRWSGIHDDGDQTNVLKKRNHN
jgi:hypothetical protein